MELLIQTVIDTAGGDPPYVTFCPAGIDRMDAVVYVDEARVRDLARHLYQKALITISVDDRTNAASRRIALDNLIECVRTYSMERVRTGPNQVPAKQVENLLGAAYALGVLLED